jgi:hypothetical protein
MMLITDGSAVRFIKSEELLILRAAQSIFPATKLLKRIASTRLVLLVPRINGRICQEKRCLRRKTGGRIQRLKSVMRTLYHCVVSILMSIYF